MHQAEPLPKVVDQSALQLDARRRLALPASVLKRLPSYRPAEQVELLLNLSEPGKIEVLDWVKQGESIMRVHEHLRETAESDRASLERLAVFEDRYRRLVIGSDHRISLPSDCLVHLGIASEHQPWLYVLGFKIHFELWAPSYRNQRLLETDFRDLP